MYYGPNINRNGLVLCLDAADRNSYSGSGTAWYDLSGNNKTGTLTNGPTFDSGNRGSIVFDGVNDYVVSALNLNFANGTISMWVYPSATGTNFIVYTDAQPNTNYSHELGISSANKLVAYIYAGATKRIDGSANMALNRWHNAVMTWVSNGNMTMYLNGVSDGTPIAIGASWQSGTEIRIGSGSGNSGQPYFYLNGKVANVNIYNRALSASEVLQNYNAIKSRFGL